ncbi:MAG: hypothetical protein H5T71_00470, partial [Chloroflexi bacterium]|nr:hypothetical protein [Chloroflexota bacterium]
MTAKNVVFDKIGGVKRRLGFAPAGDAVPANDRIFSMYTHNMPNGISDQLVNVNEYFYVRQIYPLPYGDWTLFTDGLKGHIAHYTTFLGQVFIVTGQDHP